jgi:hypothetical protein
VVASLAPVKRRLSGKELDPATEWNERRILLLAAERAPSLAPEINGIHEQEAIDRSAAAS